MRFKLVFKLLKPFERWLLLVFLIIGVFSSSFYGVRLWQKISVIAPAKGGVVREGIFGEPQSLNPIFSILNDADRDITDLIYNGLYDYNNKAELIPFLASKTTSQNDGKTVILEIKSGIFWHDGEPFKTKDVVFTLELIKNPKTRSPLRLLWQDIKIKELDGNRIQFDFDDPKIQFAELLTVKILPEHIWKDVLPENILSVDIKSHLVGAGPYKFKSLKTDEQGRTEEIELSANQRYFKNSPFINNLTLSFYETEEDLFNAYFKNEIDSFGGVFSSLNLNKFESANIYHLAMPRYYSVFFNQSESKVLNLKEVREAFGLSVDKKSLVERIFNNNAKIVNSVVPESFFEGIGLEAENFDVEKANQILDKAGWKIDAKTKVRQKKIGKDKEATELAFNLATSDWPPLQESAQFLQESWSKIGAKVTIKILSDEKLQKEVIKTRDFEALIFGEVLGAIPDPYHFWHSSQKRDPGLNISLYENKEADKILEEIRKAPDKETQIKKLNDFVKIINKDKPAIFLFSPDYIYVQRKNISGFETEKIAFPSKRFEGIEKWHIKTKRVLIK